MLKRPHCGLGANVECGGRAARPPQFSVEAVQWKSLWKLFFCALEQCLGIPLLPKQCRERCSDVEKAPLWLVLEKSDSRPTGEGHNFQRALLSRQKSRTWHDL